MFARAGVVAAINFMEAYLHGLAFDCFRLHHDSLQLDEHDILGEWDSKKKRIRFVDFRKKVFKYPGIIGRVRVFTAPAEGPGVQNTRPVAGTKGVAPLNLGQGAGLRILG